jgi:hypothetical protein
MADLLNLASSVLAAIILLGLGRALLWFRRLPVRRFWRLLTNDVVIMATEYDVRPRRTLRTSETVDRSAISLSTDQRVAENATSGYMISFGMTLAVSYLWNYFDRRWRCNVEVIGDKQHSKAAEKKSLIVLGSPIVNRYLKRRLSELVGSYPILGEFSWRTCKEGVAIKTPDGQRWVPKIDSQESGVDYALVIRLMNDAVHNTSMIIIAGCNMWGTQGAVRFLLDRDCVKSLPSSVLSNKHATAFMLKSRIENGYPEQVEICRDSNGDELAYTI